MDGEVFDAVRCDFWDRGTLLDITGVTSSIVGSMAFSPEGTHLAASVGTDGGDDNVIYLWEAASGNEVHRLEGHGDRIPSLSFSPDGQRIISQSDDNSIRLWDTSTGEVTHRFEGKNYELSSNGTRIAIQGESTIIIRDLISGDEITRLDGRSIAFSPDGLYVASVTGDGIVRLLNADSGAEIDRIRPSVPDEQTVSERSATFSPDGTLIVSGSDDRIVLLWDVTSASEESRFEDLVYDLDSVVFSPDGAYMAYRSRGDYPVV